MDTIDTLGRTQRANHVNESGLYALILGSTKDTAKRFKRWVTGEVLPVIRKTGSYAAPGALAALPAPTHDRVSAILLIGEAVAKVPGVKPGIAAAATLTCIQENTGITTEVLRMTMLAPDIVEAIFEGRQPRHLNLHTLRGRQDLLPCDWSQQRRFLGFPDA